jgi:hypothetical protein
MNHSFHTQLLIFALSIFTISPPSVSAQVSAPNNRSNTGLMTGDSIKPHYHKNIPLPNTATPRPSANGLTEAACSGTQTINGCNGSTVIDKSCLPTDRYFSYDYYGWGNLACFAYTDASCNITPIGWGMCLNYDLDVPQISGCYTTYYRTTDLTCTGLTRLQASRILWLMDNAAAWGLDVNTIDGRADLNWMIWQITNPSQFPCTAMCQAAQTAVTTPYSDIECRISILCPENTTVQPMVLYSGLSGGNYPPTPTVTITQPNCTTPTGSVTITNLRPGYSSNINGGAWTQYQTTYTNLAPGTHTIGTGFGGCNRFTTITINNPPNYTSGGSIGINQTWCGNSFDPIVLFQTSAPTGGSGTTEYQWQISTNNSTWTDIVGATSNSYDPPSITATRYFRRGVRRLGCTNYYYSNTVTITLNPPVSVVAANTGPYCVGATIDLRATPSGTATTAVELVTNGNFSSGNTGFSTDYVLSTNYAVTTNPNSVWSWAPVCTGYGGSGNMMVGDGNGNANARFWYQTINVTAGTTYTLSFYALDFWGGASAAKLQWGVNGTKTGTISNLTTGGCNTWQLITTTWTATTTGAAVFAIYDNEISAANNDFAIDNVSITYPSVGGSFSWSGSNSFSSSAQNPIRTNATTAMAGNYTVIYTAPNGCIASASTTVSVSNDPSVTVAATATGICVGGNSTLNATLNGGAGTCTIQWQSFSGSAWSNISGATGNSYTTPALSNQTRYRAQVNCSGNGCCN